MKTEPKLPQLNDYPDYVAANERLNELKGQLAGVEREEAELQDKLRAPRASLEEAAERFLESGEQITETSVEDRKRLAELRQRLAILRRAVDLQRRKVEQARSEASRDACEAMKAAYGDLVAAELKAAKALAAAQAEGRSLRESLASAGFSLGWLPVAGVGFSVPDLRHGSAFWAWCQEAEVHGYVKPGQFGQTPAAPVADHMRRGEVLVAAGPDGVQQVQVQPDGSTKHLKWLAQPEESATRRQEGWLERA